VDCEVGIKRGRVHQSSHKTRSNCKGRRPDRSTGEMESEPVAIGFVAIYMFAGKTAISSAISPHAAALRIRGTSSPNPPRISKAPLTRTNATCHGR